MSETAPVPSQFSMLSAYPNPFNPVTNITFEIAENSNINIDIYDIKGNHIDRLISGYYPRGVYSATWNAVDNSGREVSSGIYIYQLKYSDGIITKKMTLVR